MDRVPVERCEAAIEIGGSIRQCASQPHDDGTHLATVDLTPIGGDDAVTAVVSWPADDLPAGSRLARAIAE